MIDHIMRLQFVAFFKEFKTKIKKFNHKCKFKKNAAFQKFLVTLFQYLRR